MKKNFLLVFQVNLNQNPDFFVSLSMKFLVIATIIATTKEQASELPKYILKNFGHNRVICYSNHFFSNYIKCNSLVSETFSLRDLILKLSNVANNGDCLSYLSPRNLLGYRWDNWQFWRNKYKRIHLLLPEKPFSNVLCTVPSSLNF